MDPESANIYSDIQNIKESLINRYDLGGDIGKYFWLQPGLTGTIPQTNLPGTEFNGTKGDGDGQEAVILGFNGNSIPTTNITNDDKGIRANNHFIYYYYVYKLFEGDLISGGGVAQQIRRIKGC